MKIFYHCQLIDRFGLSDEPYSACEICPGCELTEDEVLDILNHLLADSRMLEAERALLEVHR